jgi:thymidylate synthase
MLVHETESLRFSYHELAKEVLDKGRAVSPRGRLTFEVSPAVISCRDPLAALPTGTGRGVVAALAAVEALSLIGGEADPALFVAAAPHYASFVDPRSGQLDVAYGRRLARQLEWAELRLRQDKESRQAHVQLWDRHVDVPGLRAYPCVTTCGFQIRDGELEAFVEMRSNDLWLGLPYDAFAFGQLQATLANVLDVEIGWYHHYARSLHIYADDAAKATELFPPRPEAAPTTLSGVSGRSMAGAQAAARQLLRGNTLDPMTESEDSYLRIMREKVLPKVSR